MSAVSFNVIEPANLEVILSNIKYSNNKTEIKVITSTIKTKKDKILKIYKKILETSKLTNIVQKYKIIVFLTLFFLSGLITYCMFGKIQQQHHYTNSIFFNSLEFINTTFVEKPLGTSYSRNFLCLNSLNFLVENNFKNIYDFLNVKENDDELKIENATFKIRESLKRACEYAITDIMIPESKIDTNRTRVIRILKILVEEAKLFNVRISLLLDEQYTVPFDVKHYVEDQFFAVSSYRYPLFSLTGYILNHEHVGVNLFIKNRMEKFVDCGIRTFFSGENPISLEEEGNFRDLYKKNNLIDFKVLKERATLILKMAEDIKLFYLYDNEHSQNEIKRSGVKYHGGIYRVRFSLMDRLDFNETSFTLIFKQTEGEKKVLLFDLLTYDFDILSINLIIGFYLFSPVPLVLKIENGFWHNYFQGVFTQEGNEIKSQISNIFLNFRSVLMTKKNDPFFKHISSLLEDVKCLNGVIMAISGIYVNNEINQVMILLYGKDVTNDLIDLHEIYENYRMKYYKVLYGNDVHENIHLTYVYPKIWISSKQVLIIKGYNNN